MSLNIAVQQLAAGAAAYLAGLILVSTPGGGLLRYAWVGYVAVVANGLSLLLVRRIRAVPRADLLPAVPLAEEGQLASAVPVS